MGSKNHEVVPTQLIAQISGLRSGGVNKLLGSLAKRNLAAKVQNSKYDGYRLTYGGYDYLAMRALSKRSSICSVGNQIGVGKESDIYVVADEEGNQMALKLHRLGRVSFRAIKSKRDYMGKRKSASWMYMSRLAAQKEWAFMKVLHEHGFPVPKPVDQARHCVVMELLDAYPLRQVNEVPSPGKLYSQLMDLIVQLAHVGLIHGDFNEFNILIHRETGEPVVIDFPQMVSTSHVNAEWYFNRDVQCIRTFFRRRFRYEGALFPVFGRVLADSQDQTRGHVRLDIAVAASGFVKEDMEKLEAFIEASRESKEEKEHDMIDSEAEDNSDADESSENDFSEDDSADDQGSGASEERQSRLVRSACPSPTDSLVEHAAALELDLPGGSQDGPTVQIESSGPELVAGIISGELAKHRIRQRHHKGRGSRRVGRPKGSKAKQNVSIRQDGWM